MSKTKKTWVRIPSSFPDTFAANLAEARVGADGMWLWVKALLYSAEHDLDGRIDTWLMQSLAGRRVASPDRIAAELVRSGLWVATETGFEIAGYASFADTAEIAAAKRDTARRRKIPTATRARVTRERICGICGEPIAGPGHIDHITPVSKGGLSVPENLRHAHARCNLKRGNREDAR